ncbi:DUF551 domain-containing protein [Klebsiella pneumoniae]|uniref:DUF551 domain-containing protein n=1 Tax=Klebsiella pneumoniae TaxID=573 RepID=UPI001F0522F7|nr:DUF551 domain-containing protein [Klebsiella pneumoniae]MCH0792056.1 DUF551 domain-containing protein [Klebsiella pneumoniae]
MSEFSRETLLNIIETDHVQCGEASALARMTLVAMDSELDQVAPDAATAIRACLPEFPEAVRDIVEECADIAENSCRAAMLQELKKSAGTEAICRSDENVQVLHTKSPAQSDCCPAQNQGWIPVSEQMPEVGDIVLTAMGGAVNVGEMECSAANCRFFTSVISGRELPATHWMPLPAGPKEDINALIPLVSRNEQEGK